MNLVLFLIAFAAVLELLNRKFRPQDYNRS